MIDRVASTMLGEMPWPPTAGQGLNIGIALAEVASAMWLWGMATTGKSLTLKPWQLRTAAVLSGGAALWAIYHVRSAHGGAPRPITAAPPPIQGPYALPGGAGVDWRTLV